MKMKNFRILVLLFLTLIISIGAISASEDVSDLTNLDDVDSDVSVDSSSSVSTDQSANDVSVDSSSSVSTDQSASDVSVDSSSSVSTDQSTVADKSTTEKKATTTKKISTKVSADQVANEYKISKYFKVKVKDNKGKAVKNVKIKLKVYTGSKTKTYTVKTNSKGIAKFNTKSLKLGNHKVVISSANSKYKISKTSRIFIGKKHYAIVKPKSKKVLKNKDVIGVKIVNDDDEKEAKVVYKKTPKHTKIIKAVFYLKNKKTGKVITKTDSAEFDDGHWDLPDEDFSRKYSLVKVKVYYLSTK